MKLRPLLSILSPILLLSPVVPIMVMRPELALAQEVPDPRTNAAVLLAEADHLFQQGTQQYQVSQFREALQSWEQALELYRDPTVQAAFPQESRWGEGSTLGNLGIAHNNLGQYQQAIDFHEQELAIAHEIGDRQGEGVALGALGNAYSDLSQYQQAINFYEQSLVILQEVGHRQGEGAILGNLGNVSSSLGQYEQAITFYEQSLVILRELDERRSEGRVLGSLGFAYNQSGDYSQALDFYEQSLVIVRDVGDRQGEGLALSGLGLVHLNLGEYLLAIDFFEQGIMTFREIGDRREEGNTTGGLGLAYFKLGQYLQAINFFEQSLTIAREIGNQQGEGLALGNLGTVYSSLGQDWQPIEFFEQSLSIAREIGDRYSEGLALGHLSRAYFLLGQYQQATFLNEQQLAVTREIGDRQGEVAALSNLGSTYRHLGQHQQAISYYEQVLVISREMGDRYGEGIALGNLGVAYADLGQHQQAVNFYHQRLVIAREIGDRSGEGSGLNNLGVAYYNLRQFPAATEAFLEAIAIYDTLRTDDLPDTEKVTFFDTYLNTYLNLQRSLIAQNEPEQALVYAERGRARAFVELLATRITNNGNPTAVSLESIDSPDLSEIQRIAREQNATLVNYSVIFDESLLIWVIQPTGEIAFQQVDLGDRNLSELVSLVREAIGVRGPDTADAIISLTPEALERQQTQRQQQLQELHQLLIEPIAQSLPTDPTQRVIFIPHQDLFLVPFAALVDGNGDYLIEHHTILTAPSIQVLDLTRQQAIANNIRSDRPTNPLIVGNPIMPSVWNPQTNQTQQLSSLPGAEREAIAIAEALNTEALLWDDASKTAVMAQMPNARIIHLATHGLLEYGSPQDSGVLDVPGAIALAPSANESGLLTAAEILQMNLNADLVVLSACDTGRGRITGDGVIGLSRAFVTAGVPSLMVSLWAVDDAATAEWMVTFYDQWQQTGDKAQAVRQAMLTTMETHPDPRLWAAFTLIGSAQ